MVWMPILILVLIIVIAIAAIPILRINQEEYRRTGMHPKGHYLGLGMAIGMATGVPLGIATGNMALGPAIGLPIGLALGAAWEKKHEDELRPRTEREEKLQRLVMAGLGALLILGIAVLFAVWNVAGR